MQKVNPPKNPHKHIISDMPSTKQHRHYLIALGSRIRTLRAEKNISQKKLADLMGKDRQSLCRVELGQVNPGYLFLWEVCEALDVAFTDFFKDLPQRLSSERLINGNPMPF